MTRWATVFAAAACALIFIAAMSWGMFIKEPQLTGSPIYAQAGSSNSLRFGAPGVYKIDRSTGRPSRIPASLEGRIVLESVFGKSPYPGYAMAGLRAMTQSADGIAALGSLLGLFLTLVIGIFLTSRRDGNQAGTKMHILCHIGLHSWSGCTCLRCGKVRAWGHSWSGCKCSICGEVRDQEHTFSRNECVCTVCGSKSQSWEGCKCSRCQVIRDEQHEWQGLTCAVCGEHKSDWKVTLLRLAEDRVASLIQFHQKFGRFQSFDQRELLAAWVFMVAYSFSIWLTAYGPADDNISRNTSVARRKQIAQDHLSDVRRITLTFGLSFTETNLSEGDTPMGFLLLLRFNEYMAVLAGVNSLFEMDAPFRAHVAHHVFPGLVSEYHVGEIPLFSLSIHSLSQEILSLDRKGKIFWGDLFDTPEALDLASG